ncbi:hypothetical protein GMLC_39940 [Geomonas limicola]|uniref:Uncharacterized protein n=1 Tax=Geomonas limicola TaxID=2740186 RepID=A0A6V8NCR9_9BACT|nr:hypothetical protein GMLC_39940 [Geomonas limicola]
MVAQGIDPVQLVVDQVAETVHRTVEGGGHSRPPHQVVRLAEHEADVGPIFVDRIIDNYFMIVPNKAIVQTVAIDPADDYGKENAKEELRITVSGNSLSRHATLPRVLYQAV